MSDLYTTAVFRDHTVNNANVLVGRFYDTSTNVGLASSAFFNNAAVNNGNAQTAVFSDTSVNTGTVSVAYFTDSAVNDGTIAGNAIFTGTSVNTGTVQGDAQFQDGATDNGTVNGTSTEFFPWLADNSGIRHLITLNGTVYQTDEGGGVIVAEFVSGKLTTSLASVGTGDYTVETFIKIDAGSGYRGNVIADFRSGNDASNALIYLGGTGGYNDLDLYAGGQHNMTTNLRDSVWHHIAITRSSGTSRMYIDGSKVGETAVSYDISNTQVTIGCSVGGEEPNNLHGKLAGYRIVKGTALYTESTYTVPTSLPTAVTGTELLLNFGATAAPLVNHWYDDTSSANRVGVVTLNGTVTQSDEGSGVKAALFGADGYFDIAPQAGEFEFTGNFTLEAFVKQPSNNTVDYSVFVESDGTDYFALNINNTYVSVYLNSPTLVFNEDVLKADVWNHLALVRSGSVVKLYINGVGTVVDSNNSSTLGFASPTFSWVRHNSSPSGEGSLAGFRMTDTAVYTSDFLVPTSLPTAVTGTQLLLNFGATAVPFVPNWFSDSSSTNRIVSISTTGVSRSDEGSGIKAASFNTGYIDVGAVESIGAGAPFTFEAFVKFAYAPTNNPTDFETLYQGGNGKLSITRFWNGTIEVAVGNVGAVLYSNYVITDTAWHHIAVSRNSSVTSIYIDGVARGSVSDSRSYTGGDAYIGRVQYAAGLYMKGKMTGIRLVTGSAIYTSNFSAPTSLPTNVSGTQLLLNFGATAAPTVPTPLTRSIYGTFASNTYISTNSSISIGTGDFTFEGFIKPTQLKTNPYDTGFINGIGYQGACFYVHYDSSMHFGPNGVGAAITSTAGDVVLNDWQHVAVVRESNQLSIYINGVRKNTASGSYNYGTHSFSFNHDNSSYGFVGSMANIRISNVARYSGSSFSIPMEAFTSDGNTLQLALNNATLESGLTNHGATLVGIS